MPVIRRTEDRYELIIMARWGLIPSWAKDPKTGYRMINARAETVAEKPLFRSALIGVRPLAAITSVFHEQ